MWKQAVSRHASSGSVLVRELDHFHRRNPLSCKRAVALSVQQSVNGNPRSKMVSLITINCLHAWKCGMLALANIRTSFRLILLQFKIFSPFRHIIPQKWDMVE